MNPNLTTQAGTQQLINQAYQQGQALQNQFNQQSSQLQGQYGQDVNAANYQRGVANNQLSQANSAYQNLLNYTQNLPSTYTKDIGTVGGALGYNPALTSAASQNSANIAEAYANVPRAAQQMSNYSGATAGQETQNLSNMASNLSGANAQANQLYQNQLAAQANVLGGVNQIVNNQQTGYGNLLTGANATLQGANQLYSNAVNQMQTAGQTMQQIESLQQQQGVLTSQQVTAYQNAYTNYMQAKAAAAASYAAANASNAKARASNLASYGAYQKLMPTMAQRQGGGYNFTYNGQPISAETYAQLTNTPFSNLLQTMAAGGDTGARQAYSQLQLDQSIGGITPQLLQQELGPSFTWGYNPSRAPIPTMQSIMAGATS